LPWQFYRATVRAVPARLDKTRVMNCRAQRLPANSSRRAIDRSIAIWERRSRSIARSIDRSRFGNEGVAASRDWLVPASTRQFASVACELISHGNVRARMRNFEIKSALELQIDAKFDIIAGGRNYAIACTLQRCYVRSNRAVDSLASAQRETRRPMSISNSISTVPNRIITRARILLAVEQHSTTRRGKFFFRRNSREKKETRCRCDLFPNGNRQEIRKSFLCAASNDQPRLGCG